nr:methyl-accepting chemotaxis protein [Anthocerotibacter panamensis]
MVSATDYQRAVEAFAQEQYEEAAQLFIRLVQGRPDDPNLRLWLASAQQQIGQVEEARSQYQQVLELTTDPEVLQTAQKALQRLDLENYDLPPEPEVPLDLGNNTFTFEPLTTPASVGIAKPVEEFTPSNGPFMAMDSFSMTAGPDLSGSGVEEAALNLEELTQTIEEIKRKFVALVIPLLLLEVVGGVLGHFLGSDLSFYLLLQLGSAVLAFILLLILRNQLIQPAQKLVDQVRAFLNNRDQETVKQRQEKEDLQRQVIKLLDEVEGAARGDLTVQAEVTADIMGAVADSFNLTIQNLRQLVQKVKDSASTVNFAALSNEAFARTLSEDALRQAREVSASGEAVQQMTTSILQVATNARKAETVARQASQTATRGGEAVERTLSGILSIRETVSETGKKVKRLAESTQEISKIVALINQLSSRTNLLALNSSIEAVRAGEAGRGFAIVADEVRQLADRAAKATREIEQIVLNIQSETSAVMAAMEEGTQQVVQGTSLAEEAKQSLEEIIQVSRQIDGLVAEIADSTVKQEETAKGVSQVMRSVEGAAQRTSRESRQVSDSLKELVAVATDLQEATDRFQVLGADAP